MITSQQSEKNKYFDYIKKSIKEMKKLLIDIHVSHLKINVLTCVYVRKLLHATIIKKLLLVESFPILVVHFLQLTFC